MKCRRYYCRLDQLFDILSTRLSEGSSTRYRSQRWCRRQRAGTANEALEHPTAETAHKLRKMPQTRTFAIVQKGTEDNATTKGTAKNATKNAAPKLPPPESIDKPQKTRTKQMAPNLATVFGHGFWYGVWTA